MLGIKDCNSGKLKGPQGTHSKSTKKQKKENKEKSFKLVIKIAHLTFGDYSLLVSQSNQCRLEGSYRQWRNVPLCVK
jgi:hypothetical protein